MSDIYREGTLQDRGLVESLEGDFAHKHAGTWVPLVVEHAENVDRANGPRTETVYECPVCHDRVTTLAPA